MNSVGDRHQHGRNLETFAGDRRARGESIGQTIDNRALLEQIIELLKNMFKKISIKS